MLAIFRGLSSNSTFTRAIIRVAVQQHSYTLCKVLFDGVNSLVLQGDDNNRSVQLLVDHSAQCTVGRQFVVFNFPYTTDASHLDR